MVAIVVMKLAIVNGVEIGLAFLFGKFSVPVHVERLEDFGQITFAERVAGRVRSHGKWCGGKHCHGIQESVQLHWMK
jgi:hypothetical protein